MLTNDELQVLTDADLRTLFAVHCECRPLDLHRTEDDHSHDCDTAILHDIQVALYIVKFDDIGRSQAMREARARCVNHWNKNLVSDIYRPLLEREYAAAKGSDS